ncbi:hypothetical protein DFH09DRAFT_1193526 [Mycena vulgaris]|nr:hypothetical protein DFH09DRAFT_1193526 [Mycena vulgaris]
MFGRTNNDNQFYRSDLVVPQQNFNQYEYSDSTEVQISVANADPFPNSLGTAMSWGPAQTDMHRNANAPYDNNNTMSTPGNLVAGWTYPGSDERPLVLSHSDRPPPRPSHLAVPVVGLQRRGVYTSRRSHNHSDLSAFMPDQDTGRGRGQHRTALSIPNSRSVNNGSRAASPHGAIHFNVQTPAMYSPSAPSSLAFEDAEPDDDHGFSIGRRRTFTAIRDPDEQLLPPASTLTLTSRAKGRGSSDARRIKVTAFTCPLPGCLSTFTARHNLINHINSHNKHRPHRCMCGMSFTTQGVLNRHKKRCRKDL